MINYLVPRKRPIELPGTITRIVTGCGKMYVTISRDEAGLFEVFAALGKSGQCGAAQIEAICRMTSLALRAGIDPQQVVKQLMGIRCPNSALNDGVATLSCADAIAKVLNKKIEEIDENQNSNK